MPHRHAPFAQRSARVVPQSVQALPGAAQVDSDIAWQLPLLSQQPLVHDAALQTHCPFLHCWPAAHAWPSPPQTQAPVLSQRSASECVLQSVQNAPFLPQMVEVFPWHTPSWQQPLAHVVLSQPEQ
jgi:hypothetical protein